MMRKLKITLMIVTVMACLVTTPMAEAATELNMYYPVAVGGPLTKIVDSMVADFMKENQGSAPIMVPSCSSLFSLYLVPVDMCL